MVGAARPLHNSQLLIDELQRAQSMLTSPQALHLEPTYEAPAKPRAGDIRLALSPWNPGAGNGFYGYYGGAWVKLG